MAHQDQASIMLRASRPEIEEAFGIRIEPRGETIIGSWEARQTVFYRDQLRYNAAKWELAQLILAAFEQQRVYDLEVRDAIRDAQRDIDEEVREAREDWYRKQAAKGKAKPTPFEPSFSRFRALFLGLRREVLELKDKRVKSEVESLILALTHLSHNEFPAEALGFDVETPEQRKARKAEISDARRAEKVAAAIEVNAADSDRMLEVARTRLKNSRRIQTGI